MGLDWSGAPSCGSATSAAVPPDHEHSNYRMAKESLLDHVSPRAEVHRIEGELGHREAAAAYEQELRTRFGDGVPELDLMLLGLGPDAHTASLFPGDAALGERERPAVGVETPGMAPLVSRVTLTLPVLNAGHDVVFLISGEDKAEAVARAFGDAPRPDAPASLVDPGPGRLTLLVDPPAAARLGAADEADDADGRGRRQPVPADRRLRLPVGLRDLRAGGAQRQRRVDVPAAVGLAQRVRRDPRPRRRRLPARPGRRGGAGRPPLPARARWCSRPAGARAAAGSSCATCC